MRAITWAAVLILPVSATLAAQDTPQDLADMVGARAGQAEGELVRRGYEDVRGEKGDDRSYTYWWNAERKQCVTIATMNGRYDSITSSPAPDCDRAMPAQPAVSPPKRKASQTAPGELPRLCKGAAARRFAVKPWEITTNADIRQPYGFIVQGWFQSGKHSTFFNCRFDQQGRLLGVS